MPRRAPGGRAGLPPARPSPLRPPPPAAPPGSPGQIFAHVGRDLAQQRRGGPALFLLACLLLAGGLVLLDEALRARGRVDSVRVVFLEDEAARADAQVAAEGGLRPFSDPAATAAATAPPAGPAAPAEGP